MRTRILTAGAIAVALSLAAYAADRFPTVEGENLNGAKVSIPDIAKGQPAVFVLGFTHGSQPETKAWAARLNPEVRTYSIAVLEDVPRLVRGMVKGGIKGDVAQNQRDRFVMIFHGEKELKAAAGFDRPDDAYILLLQADGTIVKRWRGPVTDAAVHDVTSQIAAIKQGR